MVSSASSTARLYQIQLNGGAHFWIPDDINLKSSAFYNTSWLTLGGQPYDITNPPSTNELFACLLYTSDAADDYSV